ncbi:MAG: histidine kinase [Bacteroidia bacterium]|nr:histidine kinase [Bacteroidia bacterium]
MKGAPNWKLVIHMAFWIALGGIFYLVLWMNIKEVAITFSATIVNLLGIAILVYGNLNVLIPRFFSTKKYVTYGILLFLLLVLTSLFRYYVGWGMVNWMGWAVLERFGPNLIGSMTVSGAFALLLSTQLGLIENWFKKNELEQELKTHQLEAELRFLKAQVNPHFLFNALNNIYSLSFTQSSKAPEMILKLSDMMSYMLYDCKNESVHLESEINYLKKYIDLQQLKKDGELDVAFELEGDLSSIFITPMLFIPFFENAFKHGNIEDVKNGWLRSKLSFKDQQLIFSISNSLKKEYKKYEKGGVGLENIRQRLVLLFPDRHHLQIAEKEDQFDVNLTINMNPS